MDDAEADAVSCVVPLPIPLANDDMNSVRAEDLNVDANIGVNLDPHLAPDCHVDVAVGVVSHSPVVVDQLPDYGVCLHSQFDLYAFGEQVSYSDTTLPLPNDVMEMIWAPNWQNEYDDYSADIDYDHNGY